MLNQARGCNSQTVSLRLCNKRRNTKPNFINAIALKTTSNFTIITYAYAARKDQIIRHLIMLYDYSDPIVVRYL